MSKGNKQVKLATVPSTAQKAMKDETIEIANDTRNTHYVFHCSPVVKHIRCRLLLINRNGNSLASQTAFSSFILGREVRETTMAIGHLSLASFFPEM